MQFKKKFKCDDKKTPIKKKTRKIINWKEYNKALKQCDSLASFIEERTLHKGEIFGKINMIDKKAWNRLERQVFWLGDISNENGCYSKNMSNIYENERYEWASFQQPIKPTMPNAKLIRQNYLANKPLQLESPQSFEKTIDREEVNDNCNKIWYTKSV